MSSFRLLETSTSLGVSSVPLSLVFERKWCAKIFEVRFLAPLNRRGMNLLKRFAGQLGEAQEHLFSETLLLFLGVSECCL